MHPHRRRTNRRHGCTVIDVTVLAMPAGCKVANWVGTEELTVNRAALAALINVDDGLHEKVVKGDAG